MTSEKITIEAQEGLHARPAGDLAKLAKSFPGTVTTLSNGTKKANATSILSILSLALKKGTEVEVSAEGPEEARAVREITGFLESLK